MVTANTTVTLCPADCAIASRCMVHYYFYNATGQQGFMDFDTLRTALYQTLRVSQPIGLATGMRMTSLQYGGITAEMSPEPKLPSATMHHNHTHTVAAMLAADFSPESQPPEMTSLSLTINPLEGDALVAMDYVQMVDGVGLAFSFSHAVFDMGACARLCEEWSRVARAMFSDGSTAYTPQELNVDRKWFWDELTKLPAPGPSDFDKHLDELVETASSTPEKDTALPNNLYRIGISVEQFQELGAIRNRICPGVSVPNFISAAIWHSICQTNPSTSPYTYFAASLTVRSDKRFAEYWGNTATMKYISQDRSKLTAAPIETTARAVQQCVTDFTPADFVHIIDQYTVDDSYIKKLRRFVENDAVPWLMVTNMSRHPYYNVDFGFGPPAKVLWPPTPLPSFAVIFPKEARGGIDIYLCVPESTMEEISTKSIIKDHIAVMLYNK
ncbi:hypothetical protein GGF46_003894 [Coemansia sp. RSA 552]|nr:hypothetical protein GGF46_003894 [Coemansia sp. RSA 552]